ncbi:4-(cytidine 5'-diphospho)-2-C-methyl-D-erythritol kinase [Pigmentiphaga sp.]|uniref:4-(cytidine 5'-diphospho)-2-C-methyl-D-erythritol kinase n=1 Tax=Pigmentiphaga sp. TaxID=1977564 RepID=UPI00128DEA65|nr:4-(cytidine 5'-diphospho)-2-C-methyl-D-erythritol kinase [Pigmentiphaga sp.]MPS27625.1 4-(cytidine 5'-diphospho)-2-C-methyl-D-erythritol kinase [Alcaligenaceae bacterium SAGV5]MPS50652.1 4-(cytidine 5'-diphospho)-2-C-methyl-D-erythritol kinase [Alcaligenaceae bacterium SAGV3]MPT56091.1 4-(cytidine 5'-diphospho)-2-C-methyl-D-erythritol kinase [Alcaligenaceae bacterium]
MAAELRDVPAPAKINLFLHVVGRRPDGYHLLQTVFRFIDLQDTLHFRARPDGRIVRAYDLPGVSEDADLIVRAARALQQATGCTQGAEIGLEKRIPAGGGLGGGSSDAATVLLALNRLWGTGLPRRDLMRLALPLGADVPVFVFGRNAFAEGVGEELTAIDLPPCWYVLVQPDASVPTADVFRAPELTRDTPRVKIADFPRGAFNDAFRNDLENVVFARFSEVGRVSAVLAQVLDGARVRMSGSGACLFVEYDTQARANGAVDKIAATMQGQPGGLPALRVNLACAGLDAHPLLDWAA